MKNAPIAIPVYDRPMHFRNCIESLRKNKGAEDTTLYVCSDGPKDERSAILVGKVREYIKTIHGFRDVIVFQPKENTARAVWFETRQNISNDNSKYIITEDDNVFSPYFLDFMNKGLEAFENEPLVAAICGYNYPGFPCDRNESIALRDFSAWGYGTWSGKDPLSNVNMHEVAAEVFDNKELFRKINDGLPHVVPIIRSVLESGLRAGDAIVNVHLYNTNKVCIFPSQTLVLNTGHDGSGENCGVVDIFSKQIISSGEITIRANQTLEPLELHNQWLYKFYGGEFSKYKGWLIYSVMNVKSPTLKTILKYLLVSYRSMRMRWR